MSRRYSDINRGPLLQAAYEHRQTYLARPASERGTGLGTRTKSPTMHVGVKPFTSTLTGTGAYYRVRTNERNNSKLAPSLGSHIHTLVVADNPVTDRNFTPAKIKLFVKSGSIAATSKITGIRYLKANGESYSHPFGAAADTDRMYNVFSDIATALQGNSPANHVSYSPEKISERD